MKFDLFNCSLQWGQSKSGMLEGALGVRVYRKECDISSLFGQGNSKYLFFTNINQDANDRILILSAYRSREYTKHEQCQSTYTYYLQLPPPCSMTDELSTPLTNRCTYSRKQYRLPEEVDSHAYRKSLSLCRNADS